MNATRHPQRRFRCRPLLPFSPSPAARTSDQFPFSVRSGFTLLEILLALALIALLGTVLIGGSARMLADKPESAHDVFWKSVSAARKTALLSGRDVRLAFLDDRDNGKRFTMSEGATTKVFPLITTAEVAVNFLSAQPTAGTLVILAGQAVDTQSLPYVTFYGDGTCTAFRVQIRTGVDAHILNIDPWTCAPVLVSNDSATRR
jgi:prepilin-type N-terminal cleavage/methylation domain-containing protein